MCRTKMNVHCDPFYGYQIHYPAFFEQFRFTHSWKRDVASSIFGNMLKIAQTAFVITNFEGFTVRQGNGTFCHGTACH